MSSRADLFSDENKQRRTVSNWQETASASNDAAVAEREGALDRHHHITSVHASFLKSGGLQAAATTLTVQVGTYGETLEFGVVDGRDVYFDPPLKADAGEDVTATLAAGGDGVTGKVAMCGFTL